MAAVPARDQPHALLRAIPLFGVLDADAIDRLAAALEHRTFGEGTVVINEGDRGDCVYIVAEGELEIWHDGRRVSASAAATCSARSRSRRTSRARRPSWR